MHGVAAYRDRRQSAESLGGRITSEIDAQLVAVMWMTACIDDNPGVIYLSIANRLDIDEQMAKIIVQRWRELFRPGINPLDDRKDRLDYLRSRSSELLEESKGNGKITDTEYNERKNAIHDTSSDLDKECFRSQFRRELRRDRSPPDVIKLGLDFIETHRRSYLEFAAKAREEKTSRTQFWYIFGTLFVAAIALFANFYVGIESNRLKSQDLALKQQELLLKQREFERLPLPAPAPSSPAH
jgi:hypothetical protein